MGGSHNRAPPHAGLQSPISASATAKANVRCLRQVVRASRDVDRREHCKSFVESRKHVANVSAIKHPGGARRASVAAAGSPPAVSGMTPRVVQLESQ